MKNLKCLNRVFSESRFGLVLILGTLLLVFAYFAMPDQFKFPVLSSTVTVEDVARLTEPVNETKREDQQEIKEEIREIQDEINTNETENKQANETKQEDSPKIEETNSEFNSSTSNEKQAQTEKIMEKEKPIISKATCDISNWRYEACEVHGDARTIGTLLTVFSVPAPNTNEPNAPQNWTIKAQSRKAVDVKKVKIQTLISSLEAPQCTQNEKISAVVFSLGGLTGNLWHDFSDVLVPLFINSREFNGEVQFLIAGWQDWFVDKYKLIFEKLSKYEMINFDTDNEVRCYPHVIIGLKSHEDFNIDPKRSPNEYTMLDFRMFVREVFDLPLSLDIPFKLKTNEKPRVMLVLRGRNRRFMNGPEIVQALNDSNFEVIPVEPTRDLNIANFSKLVDSCDIIMGAHGAALTNIIFLRTNGIMVQIVPYGKMERDAIRFYDKPAIEMKLRYLDYSISAEETTLLEKYGYENPVIKDPDSIHKQGWQVGMKYYWLEQDIKLNLTRFKPVLDKTHELVRE
ncbi:hypothetical protein LUZ60_012747 [Juncus effusus]|nr:hypothetical protein LUZ60_012747 [Juncus effusus]